MSEGSVNSSFTFNLNSQEMYILIEILNSADHISKRL